MATDSIGQGQVAFTGSRWELAGIILRGYVLMIPTIGLYRFWQATWKRRFYWQNTVIDGDPLEYTGVASQLLVGFLFALAFFLPIYVAFFYLATQVTGIAMLGYGIVAAVLWFLAGYAQYRARDFRLSRTLWRGVRFDQRGNAWAYALRRFLWSLLMVITLGLAYPFMAANLWRYRYANTWFGDRMFAISGAWRLLAAPYYAAYFLNVLIIVGVVGYIVTTKDIVRFESYAIPGPTSLALILAAIVIFAGSVAFFRARCVSRMLSTVTIGEATLAVRVRARDLFGQYVLYVFAFLGLLVLFTVIFLIVAGSIYAAASTSGDAPDTAAVMRFFQSGTLNATLVIAVYLIVLGAFGLVAETILSLGWWAILARGTIIGNVETLRTVRSTKEDRALIGEGLADALNVGAY